MSQSNKAKNDVSFFWFDFHAECKKMHYENLEKLMSLTEQCFQNGGLASFCFLTGRFFAMNLKTRQVTGLQTAVIRTTCIDCLDRMSCVCRLTRRYQRGSESVREAHVVHATVR